MSDEGSVGLNEDNEANVRNKINKDTEMYKQKICLRRIEEIAKPNKRYLLATFNDHSASFPRDKVERMKIILEEMFAMTPEEAEEYFARLKKEELNKTLHKKMKTALQKILKKKKRKIQKARAYRKFKQILITGFSYSVTNEIPPLISIRLRNLSDIILEQICNLKDIPIPKRNATDNMSVFLMKISDWMALLIEQIYFNIQVPNTEELDQLDETYRQELAETRRQQEATKDSTGKPLAHSTPEGSEILGVVDYGEEDIDFDPN